MKKDPKVLIQANRQDGNQTVETVPRGKASPEFEPLSRPKRCKEQNLKRVAPLSNDLGVGPLDQALERSRSKGKDIFRVKLREKSRPERP